MALFGGASADRSDGADEEAAGARSVTRGDGTPETRSVQSVMKFGGSSKIERLTCGGG